MLLPLPAVSSIRSYASFNTSALLSKAVFSTMITSSVAIPTTEIEDLWFGGLDLPKGKPPTDDALKRWFRPDADFDKHCQFSSPRSHCIDANSEHRDIGSQIVKLPFGEAMGLGRTPNDSLTLLLLLDQLPRNFGRGTDYPFTVTDPLSVRLAEHFVLELKHDRRHPPYKRMWYYLPFMHHESIPHQELCLAKFGEACWDIREGDWKDYHGMMKSGLESAWRHYEVICRFGRFPGRNNAMKRESTPEEKEFLEKSPNF